MPDVSLSLLVLKTPRLDDLRRFYVALGLTLTEERHGSGPRHYSAQVGGVVLELYPLVGDTTKATTRLRFAVDHLAGVMQVLRASGFSVSEPQVTPWGERALARDPDGRVVELYQRPPG